MHVINVIPRGCSLLLPVGTVNCVQTLKGFLLGMGIEARAEILCRTVGEDTERANNMKKEVLMLTAEEQMGHTSRL